jgi:hypothetical protein
VSDYPALSIFWTTLEIFLWILWFFLLFKVLSDIFRSHDLGGWGKTGWIVFVILLPFLGVFVYVIVRGHSMGQRDLEQAQQADAAFQAYVRQAAGTSGGTSHADELAKLAQLKSQGAITEEEFQQAKAKLLA